MFDWAGEMITLMLMAVALGMDAFSVSLGMGMYELRNKNIFKISMTIGLFHIVLPFSGMVAGSFLSEKLGSIAAYIGGILIIALGVQMIVSSIKERNELFIAPIGWGLFLFALSVSVDSFSVGLTLGIYGAKILFVLLCFGSVATLLSWLGLMIGKNVQSWLGGYSLAFGGSILLLFGFKLLLPF